MQIIPDHKSEKVTKIGARLTKLSPKQFSFSIYGMSVISKASNLTRYGENIVNMWWKMFQCVYAQIVSDNNSERMTKTA